MNILINLKNNLYLVTAKHHSKTISKISFTFKRFPDGNSEKPAVNGRSKQ